MYTVLHKNKIKKKKKKKKKKFFLTVYIVLGIYISLFTNALGEGTINLFSPQLWINNRTDFFFFFFFYIAKATSQGKRTIFYLEINLVPHPSSGRGVG